MQNQINTAQLYYKISDAEDGTFGLTPLAESKTLFRRPTLLCCGGLECNTSDSKHATKTNGYIKIGRALLGLENHTNADDPVDVIGVVYPHSASALAHDANSYSSHFKNAQAHAPAPYVKQFAEDHLFPLLADDQGKTNDLSTIKRNLRNVHILAHSYGGVFAQQLGDQLSQKMEDLGFNKRQIDDATSQVVVVQAGATVLPASGKSSFTTLSVLHARDSQVDNLFPVYPSIASLLAQSPKSLPLLIDNKHSAIHRSPDHINARDYQRGIPSEFPLQPLTVVPVQIHPSKNDIKLSLHPQSRHYLACMAPPIIVNSFGSVIPRDVTNPYGTIKDIRGTPASKDKSPVDNTRHQAGTYFNYNVKEDGEPHPTSMTVRTMMSSVLANSVNNAIRNSENPDEFVPLPPIKTLVKLPVFMRYSIAPDVDFRSIAPDDYNETVLKALISPGKLTAHSR